MLDFITDQLTKVHFVSLPFYIYNWYFKVLKHLNYFY